MKKYKAKIITTAVILAVLTAVFWWGGNAPGLRGWNISSTLVSEMPTPSAQVTEASDPSTPAPVETKEPDAVPAATPEPVAQKDHSKPTTAPGGETVKPRPGGEETKMTAKEKLDLAAEIADSSSAGVEEGDAGYSKSQGMEINASTGKDKYLTNPVPEGRPVPVEPQNAVITDKAQTCILSVRCDTILKNMDWLDPEKAELVPKDGVIFPPTKVTFYEGESIFNVLVREMKKNRIHLEFENTPIYNSAYIEGIHNLYEFDCGELSGWMYKVNGWFPNYGCSRYQLKAGDVVEWVYTCDLGIDVGGYYAAAGG